MRRSVKTFIGIVASAAVVLLLCVVFLFQQPEETFKLKKLSCEKDTIGLVVTFVQASVREDLEGFLQSLKAETVLPDKIVFVVSGEGQFKESDVDEAVSRKGFDVSMIDVVVVNKVLNQAASRNVGVKRLIETTDVSILSMFDGDDLMHPQRIEMLMKHFRGDCKSDLAVHTFYEIPASSRWHKKMAESMTFVDRRNEMKYFQVERWRLRKAYEESIEPDLWCCSVLLNNPDAPFVATGWVSFRRRVWNTIQYDEFWKVGDKAKRQKGEDSRFVRLAVLAGFRMSIIDVRLGFYRSKVEPDTDEKFQKFFSIKGSKMDLGDDI